jgi:hypothetical protein
MATLTTEQEVKTIIIPGGPDPDSTPWNRYTEKYIWSLDPVTLVPVGVKVERTPL